MRLPLARRLFSQSTTNELRPLVDFPMNVAEPHPPDD